MIKITKTVKFADWMAGLTDMRLRAKIAAKIDRMALGHPGDVQSAGGDFCELRIDYGPGYYVYFTRRSVTRARRSMTHIALLCCRTKRMHIRFATTLTAKSKPVIVELQMTRFDSAEYLNNDEAIKAYLEEAFETDDSAFIAQALGTVARARGMPQIAKETGLSRDSLRKALSHEGNAKFGTIIRVMRALGLRFSVTAAEPRGGESPR